MARPSAALPDSVAGPARAYHAHHFACPTCIAAGQGRGRRCATGLDLRRAYGQAYRDFKNSPTRA